ncbi:NADP-dependent oxidoreductase [Sphingosinicellaceae bacterium]|nr:NADP-dependent oxidoreductase [Sphingosinicellaceae bacterium]
MAELNRTVRLAQRPTGLPDAATWAIADEAMPEPGPGEILVRVDYLSLDPAMRGWINAGRSYIAPVEIGAVMRAGGIGEVLKSNTPAYAPGDLVHGMLGIQKFAALRTDSSEPSQRMYKIDTGLAPPQTWLGLLGLPGLTAYFGLLDVGALKDGETVVVSAASGGVGALVGQIARLKGCHVIGIAGGPEKCRFVVDELGFDACIDYKADGLYKALQGALGEKRIDVYFDNVGGPILETCMTLLAMHARVVICGAIVGYNDSSKIQGPRTYLNLLVSRARMEGFVVFDYADRYAEAQAAIGGWLRSGKVKPLEDIRTCIDNFPGALNDLYSGGNFGKLILKP